MTRQDYIEFKVLDALMTLREHLYSTRAMFKVDVYDMQKFNEIVKSAIKVLSKEDVEKDEDTY